MLNYILNKSNSNKLKLYPLFETNEQNEPNEIATFPPNDSIEQNELNESNECPLFQPNDLDEPNELK